MPRGPARKPGETVRCELSAGGEKLGVTPKVKSVDGGDVKFDIEVDEE